MRRKRIEDRDTLYVRGNLNQCLCRKGQRVSLTQAKASVNVTDTSNTGTWKSRKVDAISIASSVSKRLETKGFPFDFGWKNAQVGCWLLCI